MLGNVLLPYAWGMAHAIPQLIEGRIDFWHRLDWTAPPVRELAWSSRSFVMTSLTRIWQVGRVATGPDESPYHRGQYQTTAVMALLHESTRLDPTYQKANPMTFRFFQSDSPLRGGLDSSAGNSLNEALLDLFDHSPGSAASKIRGYENINPTLPAGFPAFNPVFPTMIPDPINMAESIARVGQPGNMLALSIARPTGIF